MFEPELLDEIQCIDEIRGIALGDFAVPGGGPQAIPRADADFTGGEAADSCDLDDGDDAIEFQVQRVLVIAAFLEHKLSEEAKRWLVVHRILRHEREENRIVPGGLPNRILQRIDQTDVAVNAAQVEKDAGVHQGLFLRDTDPAAKILLPRSQRLAPLRVSRHDLAGAIHVAAGVQAVVDDASQSLEIDPVLVGRIVRNHKGIVLVALGGLFMSTLGTECNPRVRAGRRPELLLADCQETSSHGIGDSGDEFAELLTADVRLDLSGNQARQPLAHGGETGSRRLLAQVANKVERMFRLEPHEVAARHHANQRAVARDREMVNILLHHQQRRLVGMRPGIYRDGCYRHYFAHRGRRIQVGGDDAAANVPVGHDAGDRTVPFDQDRRDPLVDHMPRGVPNACGLVDTHRVAVHQLAHCCAGGAGQATPGGLAQQAVGQRTNEPRIEIAVGLPELTESGPGNMVDERIFDCGGLVSRLDLVHQRWKTEAVSLGETGYEVAVGVTELHRAAPDDVQFLVPCAHGQDLVTFPEVGDAGGSCSEVQLVNIQRIERRQASQEAFDLGNLDHWASVPSRSQKKAVLLRAPPG